MGFGPFVNTTAILNVSQYYHCLKQHITKQYPNMLNWDRINIVKTATTTTVDKTLCDKIIFSFFFSIFSRVMTRTGMLRNNVTIINSLLFKTDAHNYKIIGILKQLKFRLSLRHVSVHAGTIIRELFRA